MEYNKRRDKLEKKLEVGEVGRRRRREGGGGEIYVHRKAEES